MERKILMGGGPLTFYPSLRKAFATLLGIEHPDDLVMPDHPELIPAMGAAMIRNGEPFRAMISDLLSMLKPGLPGKTNGRTKRLQPLFESKAEFGRYGKKGMNRPGRPRG
jgi:activator of 2-hydroxyglutaryl-CoA dehydratase